MDSFFCYLQYLMSMSKLLILSSKQSCEGFHDGERLQIMLSGEELTVLDDFRFRKRMPSRAAAIRELLKRGLAAEGFQAAAFGAKSEEFGVIGKPPDGREIK